MKEPWSGDISGFPEVEQLINGRDHEVPLYAFNHDIADM